MGFHKAYKFHKLLKKWGCKWLIFNYIQANDTFLFNARWRIFSTICFSYKNNFQSLSTKKINLFFLNG